MRLPSEQAGLRGPRRVRSRRAWIISILVALVVLLLALQAVANFYTNYLWYRSEGLSFVWRRIVEVKIGLASVFIAVMFIALWFSLWFVDRMAPRSQLFAPDLDLVRRYQTSVGEHLFLVRTGVAAVVAFAVGEVAASQWQNWLLYTNAQPFTNPSGTGTMTDPLFNRAVTFFVFRLPFLSFVVDWSLLALVVIFLITAIFQYLNGSIRLQGGGPHVDPVAIAHLSLILGAAALVKAASYYYVQRFELDFSTRGVVQGAGYTDVHVELPAYTLLAVVALVGFVLLSYNIYRRSLALPLIGFGLWVLSAVALGVIYPAIVQAFEVTPAQSTLELPYISNNIAATRYAYGLDNISDTSYPGTATLTGAELNEKYAKTLDDADLWDPVVAATTYAKFQDERTYFQLSGLSVDRYQLEKNGSPIPEVIGVRTLDTSGIASPSWVNTHLEYTHGYGMVLAAANTATAAGNPSYQISGLPTKIDSGLPAGLDVDQPEVYFGVQSTNYVVADSAQAEIDYTGTSGSSSSGTVQTSHYAGTGGVSLSSFWTRAAFAMRFHDINLLISNLVTPQSRIIFVQDVQQMVAKAAPFLQVDSNPYPILSGGQIYWIVDAYTTSSFFPYSQSVDTSALSSTSGLQGSYNYVRNSVKVVINAYSGAMSFYIIDEDDPIIRAWAAAFPGMFQPLDEMPPDLQLHLRYPQDLLSVQATMFGRYHVLPSEASTFYSSANAWEVAESPGTGSPSAQLPTNADGSTVRITPVYEQLQLGASASDPAGGSAPSFDLVEPLVPFSQGDKLQTLAGFIVAGCDAYDYGQLTMYTTPQSIAGPALIDSEINADADVSQQISLLDQLGSAVSTGSMLLLPVGGAIVYLRPLYVSSSHNPYPQLRYVVVVYGNQVAMATPSQLAKALSEVTRQAVTGVGVNQRGQPTGPQAAQVRVLLASAATAERQAAAALAAGNLGLYQDDETKVAELIAEAQKVLSEIPSHSSGQPAGTTGGTGAKSAA